MANELHDAHVYAYIRVSTDEQAEEGYSLEAQALKAEKYIRQHELLKNLAYPGPAIEAGVSAKKRAFLKRPIGAKLDAQLQRGDHLVFPKIDRAFRQFVDMVVMLDEWEKRGVFIHVVDLKGLTIDMTGPMGRLMFRLVAAVAEVEAEYASERTKEAMHRRRELGLPVNQKVSYGWMQVDCPEKATARRREPAWQAQIQRWRAKGKSENWISRQLATEVVPDPDERLTMSVIAAWIDEGRSTEWIYQQLRDRKILTRKGEPWSRNRIERAYRAHLQLQSQEPDGCTPNARMEVSASGVTPSPAGGQTLPSLAGPAPTAASRPSAP